MILIIMYRYIGTKFAERSLNLNKTMLKRYGHFLFILAKYNYFVTFNFVQTFEFRSSINIEGGGGGGGRGGDSSVGKARDYW